MKRNSENKVKEGDKKIMNRTMNKLLALLLVLSLLLTPVLACNGGGGDDDDEGNNGDDGGDTGNGGTTPGTDPGTETGSGVGPGHVATANQVQESGGFYGAVAFRTPNGNLINSDFERFCYYQELMRNDSFRNWARINYPTPFDDGQLFDWARGKWIETAQSNGGLLPSQYEAEMKVKPPHLTCDEIFPREIVGVSLARSSPNSTAVVDKTPEPYPKQQKDKGFPFIPFIAIVGTMLGIGLLWKREKK